jgi:non-specific serine/threonine protein kinase
MTANANQPATYVFLSYASADRERAIQIADALEARGITIWMDRKSISGGSSWSAAIVRGIEECAALLVLCSAAAMESPNVAQEVQLAWERRRPLVPLLLEEVHLPRAIEYALAGRQWLEILDRPDDAWLSQVIEALGNLGVRATSVLPASPPSSASATRGAVGLPAPRHNLPVQPTAFIGRERELARATDLLRGTHLLTLTGTGGCGKTRLALRMAADLGETYADGVWLAELAPLADPALIAQTVASALGLREEPGQPIRTTLLNFLRLKRLLLVIDNCEHLIDAVAHVVNEVIRTCPDVQVLATSREALGIDGEIVWRVPSLTLPAALDAPPRRHEDRASEVIPAGLVDDVARAEAVQLFVTRAATVQSAAGGFTLTAQNAAAVVQICRRLDGIPLAIELAAARVKLLKPEQIAARLGDQFRLLTGGSRTALPRQQTLRTLVDWSYNLLTEPERQLLRLLAVFAGGFTLEAVEAVCTDALSDVLDHLGSLVDKSLVEVDDRRDESRYRLLETIRQYARDRLLEAGEGAPARDRHRDWVLALAEVAEPELRGTKQTIWFNRLEDEHENLRAALTWSLEDDLTTGLRLGAALWWFWFARRYLAEGRQWLEDLLDRTAGDESNVATKVLRGRAHLGAAWLAWGQAAFIEHPGHAAESVRLLRASDDPRVRCSALWIAGWVEMVRGDLARSKALYEECQADARASGRAWDVALALVGLAWQAQVEDDRSRRRSFLEQGLSFFRQSGDQWGIGTTLGWLGATVASLGDHAHGRRLLEESVAFARTNGNTFSVEWALNMLIAVAHAEGDYARAEPLFDESLRLARDRGPFGPAHVLATMGDLARAAGDVSRAVILLTDSLTLARDGKNLQLIKFGLGYFGMLALQQNNAVRAVCLLAAAATIEVGRGGLFNYERAELETAVATARAALREEDFAITWAAGQAMLPEQAIAYALSAANDE